MPRRRSLLPLLVAALLLCCAAPQRASARLVTDGDSRVWPAPLETPEGAPRLGLNVPYNEQYLNSLRGPHRAADPAVVDRLLQSQQLWRRAMAPPDGAAARGGGGGGGDTDPPTGGAGKGSAAAAAKPQQFSLMDCTPMYVHTKSWIDVLRFVTLRMYVCHALCLDYPACTSTAPLASVRPLTADGAGAPARLGVIARCGLRVFRGDGGEFISPDTILDVTAAGAGQVCTNAVARARNYDGGSMTYVAARAGPAAGGAGGENVTLLAQPGTQLADGLVVNVNDLWANLEVKPLRLLNALPGSDFWTRLLVPLKGGLDLRESTSQLAGAVRAARTLPEEVKALWLLSGKVNGDMSARFLHTLDAACPRWLTYPFFGAPAAAGMSVYSAYANATGPCPSTLNSLERVGAFLAGIPSAAAAAGPCAAPVHPEFNVTTACGAADRVRLGTAAPIAMQAALATVAEKAAVRGCGPAPVFALDTFPGIAGEDRCAPAYAMPAVEVVANSGAFAETYLDAGLLHDALVAARSRAGGNLSAQWPVAYKWLDLRTLANASNFEDLIADMYAQDVGELADLKLGPNAKRDRTQILTALGLLLVATFQLPIAYERNVRHTMARLADRLLPMLPRREARTLAAFGGAVISLAAPIAAAAFSLVLATKAAEEEVMLPGYPQVAVTNAPFATNAGADVARDGRLGLVTTTGITVTATPFDLALAGIITGCGIMVIIGAFLSARQQWKEDSEEMMREMKEASLSGLERPQAATIDIEARRAGALTPLTKRGGGGGYGGAPPVRASPAPPVATPPRKPTPPAAGTPRMPAPPAAGKPQTTGAPAAATPRLPAPPAAATPQTPPSPAAASPQTTPAPAAATPQTPPSPAAASPQTTPDPAAATPRTPPSPAAASPQTTPAPAAVTLRKPAPPAAATPWTPALPAAPTPRTPPPPRSPSQNSAASMV